MNGEYKIFRVFCILSIVLLCTLLLTTGILTVKYQTEQTVFGSAHSVIQIYEKDDGAVLNLNGKISQLHPQRYSEALDTLSYTVFAPINNLIELVKTVSQAINM